MTEEFDAGGDIDPTPMPTMTQNPCVKEHKNASRVDEAHPISEGLIEEQEGLHMTIDYSLAALQGAADKNNIQGDVVEETSDAIYYKVTSGEFYRLFSLAFDEFEVNMPVEESQLIVELHTKQFLSDVHGYEGDFEGKDITLCNAMNDPTPYEGPVTDDKLPEGMRYGYVDSRGLIVQKNTHSESNS